MGSYDSYESYTESSRRITPDSDIADEDTSTNNVTMDDGVTPDYLGDTNLPTLVALGGGLSTDRIVKKVPNEVKSGKLIDALNYFLDQEYSEKRDKAVIEAVEERMRRDDYRVLINSSRNDPGTGYNYHNRELNNKYLANYFREKDRETDEGSEKYNIIDMAIISHEEGGLEKKL